MAAPPLPDGQPASTLNGERGASPFKLGQLGTRNILDNERYRELDRRQRYYDCTQHDHKRFDFEGRIISPGGPTQQLQLGSEKFAAYVPMKMRRPSSPYRLGKVIVGAFTSLVFGEMRFPALRVEGDPVSQDFNQALVRACNLPVKMVRARNLGGAVGTVGLSWQFKNGLPSVSVHNGKHLIVHEWEDREALIPRYASECFQYTNDEWDPQRRQIVRQWYWYRRDWSPDVDMTFKPVLARQGVEPVWEPDEVVEHNDGLCHLIWVQNKPNDAIDGLPDYDGLYENFDDLDVVLSVITRGAILNLDPTLKLKMDYDQVMRMGVRKGSDNALAVGKDGDAAYLELEGSSIEAGIALFNAKRKYVLEVAQCVIPGPSEIAASGLSSVAQKIVYHPMLGAADLLREQYGTAITRLVDDMSSVARMRWGTSVTIPADPKAEEGTPEAEDHEGVWSLALPPLVKKEQPPGDEGEPDPLADPTITKEERQPGEGGEIEARWPPYFMSTPDDRAKDAATLQIATGQKAFLSQETATEFFVGLIGLEPDEEKRRVAAAKKVDDAATAKMFADQNGAMGGKVDEEGKPVAGGPPAFGGKPKPAAPPFGGGGDEKSTNP